MPNYQYYLRYSHTFAFFACCCLFFILSASGAYAVDLPPGEPITLFRLSEIIDIIYKFLAGVSAVIAAITIILAGILWSTAGGEPKRIDRAKAWFKHGIYGALIILGVGVLLNTGFALFTGEFFKGTPAGPGGPRGPARDRAVGAVCSRDTDCNPQPPGQEGTVCLLKMCTRAVLKADGNIDNSKSGNREGEPCLRDDHCAQRLTLTCKPNPKPSFISPKTCQK